MKAEPRPAAGRGGDAATLAFYTREAAAYADYAEEEARSPHLERFADMLPPGGDGARFRLRVGLGGEPAEWQRLPREPASTARRDWPRRRAGATASR